MAGCDTHESWLFNPTCTAPGNGSAVLEPEVRATSDPGPLAIKFVVRSLPGVKLSFLFAPGSEYVLALGFVAGVAKSPNATNWGELSGVLEDAPRMVSPIFDGSDDGSWARGAAKAAERNATRRKSEGCILENSENSV